MGLFLPDDVRRHREQQRAKELQLKIEVVSFCPILGAFSVETGTQMQMGPVPIKAPPGAPTPVAAWFSCPTCGGRHTAAGIFYGPPDSKGLAKLSPPQTPTETPSEPAPPGSAPA